MTMARTFWNNRFSSLRREDPSWAISDRGWLLVECEPFSIEKRHQYTHETMPVRDNQSFTGWREQSSLGWYLDYAPGPTHGPESERDTVLAVCCATGGAHQWFETCEQAQRWIEARAMVARPDRVEDLKELLAA
jgi:hypothetical protein